MNRTFFWAIAIANLLCFNPAYSAQNDSISTAEKIKRLPVFAQPVLAIGTNQLNEAESAEVYKILQHLKETWREDTIAEVETFIKSHPDSVWTPSLRSHLAKYYRENGFYTRALNHWELAWKATKDATDANGKRVADLTFAYWSKLLSVLGRVDELKELLGENRKLESGPLTQIANGAKDGVRTMTSNPGISYKCGTYALSNVGRALKGKNFDSKEIDALKSPTNGFSMKQLVAFSAQAGLDLVPANWAGEKTIVFPSIVHWKQNHYAAILQQRGDLYEVIDPTFGKTRWISDSAILEEASGNFMIPSEKLPKGWQVLAEIDTEKIHGKGIIPGAGDPEDSCRPPDGNGDTPADGSEPDSKPGTMESLTGGQPAGCDTSCSKEGGNNDGETSGGGDPPCPPCGPDSGSPDGEDNQPGSGGGGSGPVIAASEGMAIWKVSQPYINTWAYDQPLAYTPARGQKISFLLSYKQRESEVPSPYLFNVGPMWHCPWTTYVIDSGANADTKMIVGGGGERTYFTDNSTPEYYTKSRMQRLVEGCPVSVFAGFIITYPNGAKDYYTNVYNLGGQDIALLSCRKTAGGSATLFEYEFDSTYGVQKLKYVIDADGKTNTLSYTNTLHPAQITQFKDRYDRTANLFYHTNGILTNITDPVGIISAFKYDDSMWMTNLITPYGANTFEYCVTNDIDSAFSLFGNDILRATRVVDPLGGTNIYMLRQDSTYLTNSSTNLLIEAAYPSEVVPDIVDATGYEMFNDYMNYRNSFHWNARQSAGLPANMLDYTVAQYGRSHLRHWMHKADGNIGHTISLERLPSADGILDGQTIWYDYGNTAYGEGSSFQPVIIAWVLPDGTTRYRHFLRNDWGHLTNLIETFSIGAGTAVLLRTNQFVYAGNQVDLIQHIGPDGTTEAKYSYNGNHQILRMTNTVGYVTTNTYDGEGRRIRIQRPSGLTTTNIFYTSGDNAGRLEKAIDLEIARTNSYTYLNSMVHTHTNERGMTRTNTWDGLFRLTGVRFPDSTFITNTYSRLDLAMTIDRMGFTNSFGYDGNRHLTKATNALGKVTTYSYCSCGSLDQVTDALNNSTQYFYDNNGRATKVLFADNAYVTNRYNLVGQLVEIGDSAGSWITNYYTHQGSLGIRSNAFGQVQKVLYDIEDRITNSVNANGIKTVQTYDDLGRLLTKTYPDTGVERFAYSARGLTITTNQLGQMNSFVYNEAGWKLFETNANLEVTQFRYDRSGNLTNLIDGKVQSTKWFYDLYSRVTNKVDNLGANMFIYGYNANDWLTNRWTPEKNNTAYSYDKAGNLTNVNYTSSTDLNFKYDALNRVTNMTDAAGMTIFGYTAGGFLHFEDGPWGFDTVSYSYAHGRRDGMRILAQNQTEWWQSYYYDAGNRLQSISSLGGYHLYTYQPSLGGVTTASGLVKQIALGNGANITNAFDTSGRMLGTYLRNSGGTLLNKHEYGYNVGNQRTNQTRTAGDYVNYTYDPIGQLKTAVGKESGGANRLQEQLGYAYDAAGNLNYRTNNTLVQTFSVNSLNELTGISRSAFDKLTVAGTTTSTATNVTVNASNAVLYSDNTFASSNQTMLTNGSTTFTAIARDSLGRLDTNSISVYLPTSAGYLHDLNGNLTNDGRHVFTFDDENQLTGIIVTNEWKSEFVYDGKMRRRIERNYEWRNTNWVKTAETRFVYDGNLVVQERTEKNSLKLTLTRGKDLSGSLDGAGGIGGILALTDHTTRGLKSSAWAPQLPFQFPSSAYYHADGNGNVTMLTDVKEKVVAKYIYDPFGKTLSKSGALAEANRYRFSSKPIHELSGMYDYLRRWYAPEIQRWLNRDPLEEWGGVNLYRFVKNEPISHIDRYGQKGISGFLKKCKDFCKDLGKGAVDEAKEKGKEKVKDTISDAVKEWLADKLGGRTLKDAKADCDKAKCMDQDDPNYTITCQSCAVYECATSASTAFAADNCLKAKFIKCGM